MKRRGERSFCSLCSVVVHIMIESCSTKVGPPKDLMISTLISISSLSPFVLTKLKRNKTKK